MADNNYNADDIDPFIYVATKPTESRKRKVVFFI